MAGVRRQARIEHLSHRRMAGEQLGDGAGVVAVALHAHRQRLDPAQHQVAVERAGHGAHGVLEEARALGDAGVVGRHEPADDVGVAAEVLRRRVHDHVGAERERLLQVRRGEGVVDDARSAPCLVRDRATAAMSTIAAAGSSASRPTRGGSRAHGRARQRDEVGQVDARRARCPAAVAPGDEPERAAVRVVGDDDVIARARASRSSVSLGGEARSRRRGRALAAFEDARQLSSAGRVGLPLREYS